MKQEQGQGSPVRGGDTSRKVAKRTIGPAVPSFDRTGGGWWSSYHHSRGMKGLGVAVFLAIAGGLLWLGLRSGELVLPEIRINEESRVTMGIFLVFITVVLGLIASLAAAMWLAVSIRKSRRIMGWPQAQVRLPLKQLSLAFDAQGECRPRVEFEYIINGELYRSGRLPPLARVVREEEADVVKREFGQIRWACYNPQQEKEAYLLIPRYYLNSLHHETLCLGFSLVMAMFLGVAFWYVADEVIPVLLRAL